MENNIYDEIKNAYENVMQNGVTFSKEMGEHIQKELEKMKRQHDEWLKNKEKKTDCNVIFTQNTLQEHQKSAQ